MLYGYLFIADSKVFIAVIKVGGTSSARRIFNTLISWIKAAYSKKAYLRSREPAKHTEPHPVRSISSGPQLPSLYFV